MLLQRKKLLIVSYFYPPLNNIAARRWAAMKQELEKEFDVYIFTTGEEGKKDNADSKNIFRFGSISNIVEKVIENKRGVLHTLVSRKFTHKIRSIDHTYKSWYLKYKNQMESIFLEVKPDILLTTYGPIAPSLIGRYFKRKFPSTFWIADLRDSVSMLNVNEKNQLQRIIDSKLDKAIHSEADLICTVSQTLSRLMSSFYQKQVFTLYNGYEGKIAEVPEAMPKKTLTAYYAGYIYEHRKESFILFAKACYELKIKFKVRLLCTPAEWKEIKSIINEYSLESVDLHMPAPSSVIYNEELEADILVILEDLDTSFEVTKGNLTGKLFEYLKFPAPILAVCRADSEIKNILEETKRGLLVSSEEEIINCIDNISDYRMHSVSQISKFSRCNQAQSFLYKLKQCL